MDPSQYGPFANVVALAAALVAVFGVLLLKMLGRLKQWAWLTADSPPFLVAAGARVLAVALMAITYITINASNYGWFGFATVVVGLLSILSLTRFDRLRRLHVAPVPLVAANGAPLHDSRGAPVFKNVVIGSEEQLRPEAAAALTAARERGGVSLPTFMSGYGSPVNDPEAIWDRGTLTSIASKLTASLIHFVILAVMTLFLAAIVIDVATRSSR
jgi:hypothetical protein